MDTSRKRQLIVVLYPAAVVAAAFGAVFRLLSDDLVLPGPGAVAVGASALFGLGVLGVMAALKGRARPRGLFPAALAALLVLLGVLSSLLASDCPVRSIAGFLPAAANLFFFLLVVHLGRDREFGKFLIKAVLGVVLLQCGLGVYQFYAGPPGGSGGLFRGTFAPGPHLAGILGMMFPAAAGLLLNSVHERLDLSIWPRRILYSLALVLLVGGLYYAGNEIAWAALALAFLFGLGLTGRVYLARNLRVLLVTASVLLLLAVAAAVLQTRDSFSLPGYGIVPRELSEAGLFARDDLAHAAASPLLGKGYDRPDASWRTWIQGPSFPLLASEGGFPAAAVLLLLLASLFVAVWKGSKSPPVKELETHVLVGERRALKGIELASFGILGGTVAFFLFDPFLTGLNRTTFLLVFFPLWLLLVTTAFSYKHFQLMVENRRDFVAVGAATGAAFGALHALLYGTLLHPPSQFLLLLLLALAYSRTLDEERLKTLDFRSPKFLRPFFGAACGLLCLAAAAAGAVAWPLEDLKARSQTAEPLWQEALRLREVSGTTGARLEALGFLPAEEPGAPPRPLLERALEVRMEVLSDLASRYARDPRLWARLGAARVELLGRRLARGWQGAAHLEFAAAQADFSRALGLTGSAEPAGREGWAWLSLARAAGPLRREALARSLNAFREALRRGPAVPAYHAGFGDALFLAGQPVEAGAAWEEALRLTETTNPRLRLPPELHRRLLARVRGMGR